PKAGTEMQEVRFDRTRIPPLLFNSASVRSQSPFVTPDCTGLQKSAGLQGGVSVFVQSCNPARLARGFPLVMPCRAPNCKADSLNPWKGAGCEGVVDLLHYFVGWLPRRFGRAWYGHCCGITWPRKAVAMAPTSLG